MQEKIKITTPRYQQVAADIAAKIANQHYKVGEKIYARSTLASQYGVSAETARRALCVLADLSIVEVIKGSGVLIKSYENAVKFIQHFDDIQTIDKLKQSIQESVERQIHEIEYFKSCLSNLIDSTDRFRSTNPFVPFTIEITPSTPYLGKTASEVNFWHNTTATIIAIKKGDVLLMSPGPYATLGKGDILYFIGDQDCINRVERFLYPHK